MTRFNTYLLNEDRSKELDQREIPEFLHSNCSQALDQYKSSGYCIYRGLRNESISLVTDPTKGTPRRSLNITNYYTLLIDNLPSWKAYPKRSRSIVGVTDPQTASDFGTNTYIVFPFDNSKIGICPKVDIWYSFQNTIGNLHKFSKDLEYLLNWTTDNFNHDKDWKTLTKSFKHSETFIKDNPEKFNSIVRNSIRPWNIDIFYELIHTEYVKLLNKEMDPKKNKFRLFTPKDSLNKAPMNEVWMGGKSFLVQDEYLYDLKTDGYI